LCPEPPIGDFDLIGHRNVYCVQLGPASSALPPPDNGLDEDAWVDPSTSASPSVSAPHRSPSSSAESIHDDQHAEHRPAPDDNGLWASTGRGIRAHDPLIGNTAFLNKQTFTTHLTVLCFGSSPYLSASWQINFCSGVGFDQNNSLEASIK